MKKPITSTASRLVTPVVLMCLPLLGMSFGFLYLAELSWLVRGVSAFVLLAIVVVVADHVRSTFMNHVRVVSSLVESIRLRDFSLRASVKGESGEAALLYRELASLADELKSIREDELDARRLLEKIVDQINIAIVVLDAQGGIKLVNPSAELLLGGRSRELVGRNVEDTILRHVATETSQWIDHELPEVEGRWQILVQAYRERGVPGRIVLITDLQHILTHAEVQTWRRLIRVLAHEVNNSLTPIISITQSMEKMLRRQTVESVHKQIEEAIEVISSRSANLRDFIAEYVELAKLPEPQFEAVAISSLVRFVETSLAPGEIELCGDDKYADVHIECDRTQIEQVLINITKNALEAQVGCESPMVEVRYTIVLGHCEFEVLDHGPGFGNINDAFVPFYTTKDKGMGIGLALCKQIVNNHFGRVTLENRRDGPGACVRISLPLRRALNRSAVQTH